MLRKILGRILKRVKKKTESRNIFEIIEYTKTSDINEKIDGLQIVEINLKKLAEM